MEMRMDQDVQAVLEFMQQRIPTSKLVGVARNVSNLAPLVWGHHEGENILCLQLCPVPIDARRQDAIESSTHTICRDCAKTIYAQGLLEEFERGAKPEMEAA